VRPQHHRPGRELRGAGREEAPADLADGPGQRGGLEGEPADGASDAVGGDDEIVVATGSVAELDGDDAALVSDAVHGQPEADGHVARRLEQQFVQVGPMNREAWPDGPPELGDVDLEEQPAALVAEGCRGISTAREATCASRPSARRARAALPGKYIPVPEGRHAGSRSMTSSETPARPSIRASAKSATPPRRSARAVRSPLHRPSCTTSHLMIAAATLPTSRREASSAIRIVTERLRHVRRCLYVPPRGRSRSVTTIPIP
jgi:hypothetical protein